MAEQSSRTCDIIHDHADSVPICLSRVLHSVGLLPDGVSFGVRAVRAVRGVQPDDGGEARLGARVPLLRGLPCALFRVAGAGVSDAGGPVHDVEFLPPLRAHRDARERRRVLRDRAADAGGGVPDGGACRVGERSVRAALRAVGEAVPHCAVQGVGDGARGQHRVPQHQGGPHMERGRRDERFGHGAGRRVDQRGLAVRRTPPHGEVAARHVP